mmetsp:Transcript_6819/g.14907  ORF Transcript_6819/g.14907 Transcript_6819/m.14907 type:complete len:240 (+) Transcript_6819:1415-2134(+)
MGLSRHFVALGGADSAEDADVALELLDGVVEFHPLHMSLVQLLAQHLVVLLELKGVALLGAQLHLCALHLLRQLVDLHFQLSDSCQLSSFLNTIELLVAEQLHLQLALLLLELLRLLHLVRIVVLDPRQFNLQGLLLSALLLQLVRLQGLYLQELLRPCELTLHGLHLTRDLNKLCLLLEQRRCRVSLAHLQLGSQLLCFLSSCICLDLQLMLRLTQSKHLMLGMRQLLPQLLVQSDVA